MRNQTTIVITGIILLGISTCLGGVIDQINLPDWDGGWVNIVPVNDVSQTFTPTLPYLTGVDVDILTGNAGRGGDTITAKIMRGNDVLWSDSQYVDEGFNGLLNFELDIPIQVTSGETIKLTLSDTGKVTFGWKYV
ncbi:MAG: hypothetical protein KAS23_10500 [Anaerohalosphaera sp.]|nr:hypothetical protein [Anaerohalosphaera sp.]